MRESQRLTRSSRPLLGTDRRGLVLLNVALLGTLAAVTLTPWAGAQAPMGQDRLGHTRVRGEYALVGGSTLGNLASTMYILDSANRELLVLRWNDSSKSLEGVGYRDLARDASSDPDR